MSNEPGRLKAIYKEALDYLYRIKPDDMTNQQLEEHFSVSKNDFKTKDKILKRLLGTLQNYQSLPGVIGFYAKKEREGKFGKIFFDYDDSKIIEEYKAPEDLLNRFIDEFDLDRDKIKENSLWVRYSKAVFSASNFMLQFKDAEDFDHFVKRFVYNESTAAALPMLLSKEIYGMGFALGCDFLKEIGYDQYPKPDVHLIDIFSELGLSDRDEFRCYKEIIKMARATDETPFKVDKIFWLIGFWGKKEDFIKYIKGLGL